ncbi:hypothetical protein YPPY113_1051, partial [Yersinia pestis PY-113]
MAAAIGVTIAAAISGKW